MSQKMYSKVGQLEKKVFNRVYKKKYNKIELIRKWIRYMVANSDPGVLVESGYSFVKYGRNRSLPEHQDLKFL